MKRFTIIASAVLASAVLALPGSASGAPIAQGSAKNAVIRWVEHSLDAVRTQNMATPNAGRLYAMVTSAMYDAVNGIDRARHHGRTHALVSPSGAPVNGKRDIAAAAAARAVLTGLLRADQPPVSNGELDGALTAELQASGANDRAAAAGSGWGRHVGDQVLALRAADGTEAPQTVAACSRFSDPLRCEPGEFHASFDARFASMTPFALASASPYESTSPPALSGREYAAAFEDVRTCGSNSAALDALCADPATPAQRAEISNFWLAEGGTVRETGTWMQAALAIAEQQGTVTSTSRTARLFALVGMAIADAVRLSWQAKATYFSWRPTTAIRQADTDANPATEKDEGWTSRIRTIGATPEYNSGTSAFAGAASAVIEAFYCHEPVSFSFKTDMASDEARHYATPLEAAREAGRSRIFQGIHFQFSNEDGRRAGRGIGSEIASTKLLPVDAAARARSCRH